MGRATVYSGGGNNLTPQGRGNRSGTVLGCFARKSRHLPFVGIEETWPRTRLVINATSFEVSDLVGTEYQFPETPPIVNTPLSPSYTHGGGELVDAVRSVGCISLTSICWN